MLISRVYSLISLSVFFYLVDANVNIDDLLLLNSELGYEKLVHSVKDASNTTEQKAFYNINLGVDQRNLWYINTSVTGQKQQLRLDIAQPYVWLVDASVNPGFNGTTYNTSVPNVSPYYEDLIYNMSFIDDININASAYVSNMTLMDAGDAGIDSVENSSNELIINTIGFFVAYASESLIGSFGIAGRINNTNWQSTQIATDDFNSSFLALEAMTEEGTISHAGYSLWLAGNVGNEVDLNEYQINASDYVFSNFSVGSLMLNYVNSSLFTGDLVKFESIPYFEVFTEGQSFSSNGYPIFPLSGSKLISNTSETVNLTSTDDITPILFDSRFTVSYLPIDIIQQIAIQTNAFYVASVEAWYVDCELGNINAYIEFLFGQLSIKVPLKAFITTAYLNTSPNEKTKLYFSSASGSKIPACNLKMKPSYLSGINVLGGAFLKYAYLAADLETNQFALAQAANINGGNLNTVTKVQRAHRQISYQTEDSSTIITSKSNSLSPSVSDDSNSQRKDDSVVSGSTVTSDIVASTSHSTVSTDSNTGTLTLQSSSQTTSTSSETAMFISSGFIPFAKLSNITDASLVLTTFSAATTDSTKYGPNVLELFGYNFTYGTIFSNGEIVTATKSFYDTALPSSELTTVSGSTFYTTVKTKNSKATSDNSVFIMTVQYETYVTKINSETTMYGTSAVAITSEVAQSSATNYKNMASGGRGCCLSFHLLRFFFYILGISTLVLALI